MFNPKRRIDSRAFTIVELLIVIVVIGVLAAISVVAFSGIQDRSRNTARATELRQWEKIFKMYAAQEGGYPSMPSGGFCLGLGFPDVDGSGLGNCRDTTSTGDTRHSVSQVLNSELSKVGSYPAGPRVVARGTESLGPWVFYDVGVKLVTVIDGSDCPVDMALGWLYASGTARSCSITLPSI